MLVTEVNLGSKCRKERREREREREREGEREREQLIIEAIYLDLEDIKQSKSDGGTETESYPLHKEPIGCNFLTRCCVKELCFHFCALYNNLNNKEFFESFDWK